MTAGASGSTTTLPAKGSAPASIRSQVMDSGPQVRTPPVGIDDARGPVLGEAARGDDRECVVGPQPLRQPTPPQLGRRGARCEIAPVFHVTAYSRSAGRQADGS